MAKYTIVGFDPASTRNIGWSSVVLQTKPSKDSKILSWEGGTFRLPVCVEKWKVLWPMFLVTEGFLEEKKPDLVVLEKTSSFNDPKFSFITGQVSQCMGSMLACCGKCDVDVEFVYPTSVKKILTGSGRATKTEMRNHVQKLLEECGIEKPKFDSEHAADATANILYWLVKHETICPPHKKE